MKYGLLDAVCSVKIVTVCGTFRRIRAFQPVRMYRDEKRIGENYEQQNYRKRISFVKNI